MFIEVKPPSYEYYVKPFQANVQIMKKTGGWFSYQNVSKNICGYRPVFAFKISLFLRYISTHLASKNKLRFNTSGTGRGNGLDIKTFSNISFSDGLCCLETVQLISDANQSTGFFMTQEFTCSYFWKWL